MLLGLGGLGCPAALALCEEARARELPIELALVDDDRVERSNLARQTLYGPADLGKLKVDAAAEALRALAPGAPVELVPVARRFEKDTEQNLLKGASLLLDGTDSFASRFLANNRALAAGVPLVHGAALGWVGQLLSILPGGPCLRCLFEGPPPPGSVPACAEAGVAGPLCGLIGAAMAAEGARILAGESPRARGRLLRWDGLDGRSRTVSIPRDPDCPACGAASARSGALSGDARA